MGRVVAETVGGRQAHATGEGGDLNFRFFLAVCLTLSPMLWLLIVLHLPYSAVEESCSDDPSQGLLPVASAGALSLPSTCEYIIILVQV